MGRKGASALVASAKSIDPELNALFGASAGPVKVPPKSRYAAPPSKSVPRREEEDESEDASSDNGFSEKEDSEDSARDEDEESVGGEDASGSAETPTAIPLNDTKPVQDDPPRPSEKREKKRKRKSLADELDLAEELEEAHMRKLAEEDSGDNHASKKRKASGAAEDGSEDSEESQEGSDVDEEDGDSDVPMHESLTQNTKSVEIEKANRTVFLANVSVEAISSKSAKKTLMSHMSEVLDEDASPPEKIESIRFRSVAFSTTAQPKRAAYITKSLMDATTKSANAYLVYSTPTAARKAVAELNGTVVLDRHLRVDGVAHPSQTDHRRCVFVGNLGFVDDETVLNTDGDGNTTQKKRNKQPADVEEGLWRTFGEKAGKVENVRVVRDSKTRVGKGFAYVQFYDANDVEAALLLDDKKFPPMLPRKLRVTRAKNPQKTVSALKKKGIVADGVGSSTKYKPKITPEQKSMAGRASKLLGRAGAARQMKNSKGTEPLTSVNGSEMKTPEQIVFEGRRATAGDGLKFKKKVKKVGRPGGRRAKRVSEWKRNGAGK